MEKNQDLIDRGKIIHWRNSHALELHVSQDKTGGKYLGSTVSYDNASRIGKF
jgi:hypothetical protein